MKKILKFILSLIFFVFMVRIRAYEIYYSEWSSEYPKGVGNKIIQSEDRYLCYREVITDEKYLVKEEIGDRQVDYNDYIFSERIDNGFEQPKKLKDRLIEVEPKNKYYNVDELYGIMIENLSNDSYVSEIVIIDKETGNKIELKDNNEERLFDSDLNNYINLKNKTYINFKEYKKLDNLSIKIYCKSNTNSFIEFSLVSSDGFQIYSGRYRFYNDTIEIKKEDLIESEFKTAENFFYTDKLYKTYLIEREETDEYLKECPGYIRIDESKKTFYRYIKNDYVIVSTSGSVVEDESYCIKNFCMIEYLEYKEEKEDKPKVVKLTNPKTYDGVEKYYILSIVSVILIILLLFHKKIFLVLSNRFKYNKKSISI
ncbi:MAG: hypothetical protein IKR57_04075 [Bacilli bacterium]|nr:hypothetical protein [Bacilli bacterium]